MARPRIELPAHVEAEIAHRTHRGESVKTILEALGPVASPGTIQRRVRELRGKAPRPAVVSPPAHPQPPAQPSQPSSAPPHVDVPDDPPETTSLEDIDRWIKLLNRAVAEAERATNLTAIASLSQKTAVLLALKHKLQPLPKADPNDNPDYQRLAAEGRARMKQLVNDLFEKEESQ